MRQERSVCITFTLTRKQKGTTMKRFLPLAGAAALAIGVLAGCGAPPVDPGTQHTEAPVGGTTDPKQGWVRVWTPESTESYLYKRCDGTTLVYWPKDYRAGVAVVPNSPECK